MPICCWKLLIVQWFLTTRQSAGNLYVCVYSILFSQLLTWQCFRLIILKCRISTLKLLLLVPLNDISWHQRHDIKGIHRKSKSYMLKLIYHKFIPMASCNKVNKFSWHDSKIMFLCIYCRSKNSAFISELVTRIMCFRQSWNIEEKGCWFRMYSNFCLTTVFQLHITSANY